MEQEEIRVMQNRDLIEIVVPCFNEQECIEPLYKKLCEVLGTGGVQSEESLQVLSDERVPVGKEKCAKNLQFDWAVLFVDDGSKDETLLKIKALEATDTRGRIRHVSFSRNFGKESAIYAGLEKSRGDYVVLMDADLQHPPELVLSMYEAIKAGYDCCGARRVSRKGEPVFRSLLSRLFYRVINRVTSMNLVPGGSDYRMMSRKMVDAIVSMTERERFIKGIMSWVGFDTKWIEYENVERAFGATKWSFVGLIRYAWHGFISFATTPLRVCVVFGLMVVVAAFVYATALFHQVKYGSRDWTDGTTAILLILFFFGVTIVILGIIGEYMARIYLELKHRPIYIEKEVSEGKETETK